MLCVSGLSGPVEDCKKEQLHLKGDTLRDIVKMESTMIICVVSVSSNICKCTYDLWDGSRFGTFICHDDLTPIKGFH